MYTSTAASSVEGAIVVVGARAGEGRTGLVPRKGSRVVVCGEAEGARTLQLVLETPAEEGGLLGHFAGPGVLVVLIVGQTDHRVGLWQVPAEGGTLGRLDR